MEILGAMVYEGLGMGVVGIDGDYRVTLWNLWMERHSGIRAGDILGQDIFDRYPEVKSRKKDRYITDCIQRGRTALLSPLLHHHLIPLKLVRGDETVEMCQNVKVSPVGAEDDHPTVCVILIEDVTEQVLYEGEIIRLNRVLKGIRNINQLITRTDSEKALLDGACRILVEDSGYELAWVAEVNAGAPEVQLVSVAGTDAALLIDLQAGRKGLGCGRAMALRAAETGKIQVVSDIWERSEGRPCLSVCSAPIAVDGRVGRTLTVCSEAQGVFGSEELKLFEEVAGDIAFALKSLQTTREKLEAEAALVQQKEWLEATLLCIGDGIIATDTEGIITFMNPVAETLTGWPAQEALGREIGTVLRLKDARTGQAARNPVARVWEDGATVWLDNHTVLVDREGRETPIHDSASPIRTKDGQVSGAILVFQDDTERKQLEGEMMRLERLRAIGELSAGISHNLNNILTSVLGPAQILQRTTDNPDVLREAGQIVAAAIRARDLVHRLHMSTRGTEETVLEPVPVVNIVQEAVEATRPRWKDEPESRGRAIEVLTQLEDTPPVMGTASGLHNILVNLILYAVDDMPDGGRITVDARTAGEDVRLLVSDTGVGMDEETRRRVFEPFFTTKRNVGSGLGLATVYRTVACWNGDIEVESVPGRGTTFVIRLPVWTQPEMAPDPETVRTDRARGGRVLVVDDDQGVSHLLVRLLETRCQVEAVTSGWEALHRFAPGKYDVALIDLGMSEISGDQVLLGMRRQDPALASVLITGWEMEAGDPRALLFDFCIQKPFDDIAHVEDVVSRAIALHEKRAGQQNGAR